MQASFPFLLRYGRHPDPPDLTFSPTSCIHVPEELKNGVKPVMRSSSLCPLPVPRWPRFHFVTVISGCQPLRGFQKCQLTWLHLDNYVGHFCVSPIPCSSNQSCVNAVYSRGSLYRTGLPFRPPGHQEKLPRRTAGPGARPPTFPLQFAELCKHAV